MSDEPAVVQVAPNESVAVKKLTTEERFHIENLFLKVQNLMLQQQQMQSDLQKSVQMRQGYQDEMSALKKQLSEKYGVDMTKVKIHPDGTIQE